LAGCLALVGVGHVAVLSWWTGSDLARVLQGLFAAGMLAHDSKSSTGIAITWPTFVEAQARHVATLFGVGCSTILAMGLARVILRRGILGSMMSCWMCMAVAHVVGFKARSFDHEFWWFYLLPAVGCAGAALVDALRSTGRQWIAAGLIMGIVVVEGAWIIRARYVSRDVMPRSVAIEINKRHDDSTLMLLPEVAGAWKFYAKPWVYDAMADRVSGQEALEIIDRFRNGELGVSTLLVSVKGVSREAVDAWNAVLTGRGLRLGDDGVTYELSR
jgi:hypothetical protein